MFHLKVSIRQQVLLLLSDLEVVQKYSISSALKGVGELYGSEQTPRGWHSIRAKIGEKMPVNTVFVGRRPTGEIYSPELRKQYAKRDWILTRILWLSGLEPGKNRLKNVDTMRRYIYIHGTPDDTPMGIPGSHGCIRMRNQDILQLFNQVTPGIKILIEE